MNDPTLRPEQIIPLEDRILVEPIDPPAKVIHRHDGTTVTMELPDIAKEKPQRARVLAVGPGRMMEGGYEPTNTGKVSLYRRIPFRRVKLPVKPGDVILHGRYAGNGIEVGGKKLIIMREHDLLAVERE